MESQDRHPAAGGSHVPQASPKQGRAGSRSCRFYRDRDEEPVSPFVAWLFAQAGLDVAQYRAIPLERRLPACFRRLRVTNADEATALLTCRPELVEEAMDSMLLGVSEFFRDPDVFERLAGLLPTIATAHSPGGGPGPSRGLRVWSVGCSEGQELYSIAILLDQMKLLASAALVGTDVRPAAIERARQGQYPRAAVQHLPPAYGRSFEQEGSTVRVKAAIRDAVRFELEDVFHSVQGAPWDVILWRNAAIYLKTAASDAIWRYLHDTLVCRGLLITGRAERPVLPRLERLYRCIYQKTG